MSGGGFLSFGNRSVDLSIFFFQAEDGIRDLVRSRGLGDVYKRQLITLPDGVVVPTDNRAQRQVARHGARNAAHYRLLSLIHI